MSDKARWTCDPWPVESIGDDVDMPDDVTMKNWPLPNVWLGTSAEDQQRADERIPLLLQTPAAVRFVSLEPLLGPIDLMSIEAPETRNVLDWVICGGESGPHARPMHPDWARSLRDQCAAAGVPFFFKQWGEWRPPGPTSEYDTGGHVPGLPRALIISQDGTVHHFGETAGDGAKSMLRVGKRAAGRLLDGKEHNAMPGQKPATEGAPMRRNPEWEIDL
jgi:protein gp37